MKLFQFFHLSEFSRFPTLFLLYSWAEGSNLVETGREPDLRSIYRMLLKIMGAMGRGS